jgi:hypothetical protein
MSRLQMTMGTRRVPARFWLLVMDILNHLAENLGADCQEPETGRSGWLF